MISIRLAAPEIRHILQVSGTNGVNVPADGTTLGEVRLRGNTLMLGCLPESERTTRCSSTPKAWMRSPRTSC